MREASENTKCLVKSQIKIGTPSKEPGQGAGIQKERGGTHVVRSRGRESGRKEKARGVRGKGWELREERGRPKKRGRGCGNRAERGSPQERSVIREWRG